MNPTSGLTTISPVTSNHDLKLGVDAQFPLAKVVSETLLKRIPADMFSSIHDYVDGAWKMEDDKHRVLTPLNGLNVRIVFAGGALPSPKDGE